MQLNDIADGVVKHKKAAGFFNRSSYWFSCVDQVEDRSQYLIHPLDILNAGIEFGINVQNSGHVVISIGFALQLFILQKLLVCLWALPMNNLKLLSPRVCKIGNHNWSSWG